MKTWIRTLGIFSVIALGASAPVGSAAAAETTEAKVSAPVDVTLTASAKSGTVVITLSLKAKADIPRGVGRIVLPEGVKLVSGQTKLELGALKRGGVSKHEVTVEVPSTGQYRIFAGVDCHITSGILMHKGAHELILGQ